MCVHWDVGFVKGPIFGYLRSGKACRSPARLTATVDSPFCWGYGNKKVTLFFDFVIPLVAGTEEEGMYDFKV